MDIHQAKKNRFAYQDTAITYCASFAANSDEWVASVVNYVRYEFGNVNSRRRPNDTTAPFVTPADVIQIRTKTAVRTNPWTYAELENKRN